MVNVRNYVMFKNSFKVHLTSMSFFQPVHIRELLEILAEIGCIQLQKLVRRGKPGLFFTFSLLGNFIDRDGPLQK